LFARLISRKRRRNCGSSAAAPRQCADQRQVVLPGIPEPLAEQRRQAGIRLFQPAPHRDAIRDIDEAFGAKLREAAEHVRAHQFRMQARDAIDAMAADHRQMRHAHLAVIADGDDRQVTLAGDVAG
jgi:hypothetical protein